MVMIRKFDKIDKISLVFISILIIGVISSFFNFGILSIFFSISVPFVFIILCFLGIISVFRKKFIPLLGIIIFLISYPFFYGFSGTSDIDLKNTVSLLTYNVKGFKHPSYGNSKRDPLPEILKFVDSLNPDIVAFQEFSNKGYRKLDKYPYVFLGLRHGVEKSLLSIYSKYKILNQGYIDFDDTRNNAIFADILLKNDTVRIYNVHLQSYIINEQIVLNKYDEYKFWKRINHSYKKQIAQASLIKSLNEDSTKRNRIICGDFNATPFSQTFRILKNNLKDSYIEKGCGFGGTYKLSYLPLRLDYFLHNNNIETINHTNFNLDLSDHEPIAVRFKIK